MSKIDEPNAMELVPIAKAMMIFEAKLKERARRAESQACLSSSEPKPFFEAKPQ